MRNLLYPVFFICMLCSCSSNEDPEDDMCMTINSCYIVKNNNNLSENFSSPIGVYVLTEDNKPYDAVSYKNSASLVSGKWQIDIPVYVEKPGKVYAYYPYQSGDNPESLAVNMADQTDLLYSKSAVAMAPGSSSLSVKLYHALSQITVTVEGEEVVALSLFSPVTGQFNICSGMFSQLAMGNVAATSDKLLLIPYTVPDDTELSIRLKSGAQYSYSLAGRLFKSGENCSFQFKLNANRETLEIMSFPVVDWITDQVHNDYL